MMIGVPGGVLVGTVLPLSRQADGPEDGVAVGLHASFELRTRYGIPKAGPLAPELASVLKHSYLACVSYVDAQVGRMIAALEEVGVRENTIVVVWSDHGWHFPTAKPGGPEFQTPSRESPA
jgi:iduronate 2-sulfatase